LTEPELVEIFREVDDFLFDRDEESMPMAQRAAQVFKAFDTDL
jgi:hypothetical protein